MDNFNENAVEKWEGQTFYQELHFLLGKLTVNYNLLESKFILLICNLSNPKDIKEGFKLCKGKGATDLLELLTELININVKAQDLLDEYSNIYSELKTVIFERNKYMHSIYLDSGKLQVQLSPDINFIEMVRTRELQKGNISKESTVLYDLKPLRALIQWINHLYELMDNYVNNLSRDLPMFQVEFRVNQNPEMPLNKNE